MLGGKVAICGKAVVWVWECTMGTMDGVGFSQGCSMGSVLGWSFLFYLCPFSSAKTAAESQIRMQAGGMRSKFCRAARLLRVLQDSKRHIPASPSLQIRGRSCRPIRYAIVAVVTWHVLTMCALTRRTEFELL